MKMINENSKIVNCGKKKKENTSLEYKIIAKTTLVSLVYDMNRNTCHKMNFMIIGIQWLIIIISLICQILFNEFRAVIALVGAIGSILLMCLVIINTKISDRAIKKANEQRKVIEECIDELTKGVKYSEYSK